MKEKAFRPLFPPGILDGSIVILGTGIAIYHILSTFFIIQGETEHYITHLGSLLVLLMLVNLRKAGKTKSLCIILPCMILGVITMLYAWFGVDRLQGEVEFISDTDFIMGILMMIPVIVATWLWWGPIIPLMVIASILYFAFGHHLSGTLYHTVFSPKYVVSMLTTSLNYGMFGYLLPISANLVFYFMLFGGVMQGVGVVPSFIELGKLLGRVLPGGPAYSALIGSSLVGMITGSGSANVAVTGTFSIPAMIQSGFRRHEAAAIEGSVSTGGQITPPVMGAAGFIIASFLGVAYIEVVQMAVLGAALYYLSLFFGIAIFSYSRGFQRYTGPVEMKVVFRRFPVFIAALLLLIVLLVERYSVTFSCTSAIIVTMIMAFVLIPESRSIRVVARSLTEGAKMAAQIAMALAIIGMLAQVANTTAIAPKISVAILSLTKGMVVPSLILIAIIAVLLGMGLPLTAAYLITAVTLLPSMWALGVDIAASHFFVFYFAVWGAISPPVAPASMVASRLADTSLWSTGFTAMKFMAVMFLFPFVIALRPNMLNLSNLGGNDIACIVLFLLVSILTSITMFGWLFSKIRVPQRIASLLTLLCFTAFLLGAGITALLAGLVLLIVFVLWQYVSVSRAVSPYPAQISD